MFWIKRVTAWTITFLVTLGSLTLASSALAGKFDDTLVYASNSWPENISPYHNNLREGVILGHLAWDTLVYRDPDSGKYLPMLATDWTWKDDTHLVFNLRQGVRFQNGDPLTADDVAFTFNYVLTPESKVVTLQNVNWIRQVRKLDQYTVEFELKKPFPAALEYLAGPLPVYPEKYFKKVGLAGFDKAPIGTGPYKIVKVISGQEVDLERNVDYFSDSPIGQPKIKKLKFVLIPDQDTRLAQLMTGQVDWIWRVPSDQAEQLKSMPNISVLSSETMRVGYLSLNSRGTDREDSPFKKLKVREAVNYALDRKVLADQLVRGGSRPLYTPCFPEQFGCEDDAAVKYPYNPEKARSLLAEAGYPYGFSTDIYAYRDRDYAEAVIGYLHQIGIQAKLHYMTYAALRDELRAGHVPMSFQTWGSYSINDASAIISIYFKGGADDQDRDTQVKQWLETADNSVDPKVRQDYYQKAIHQITQEAYWAPMFSYTSNYAFTSDLNFKAYPDELPRFWEASWK
ncbi:ABC transporter substrate-binding protein [Vibrio mangrovi]|uniref:ABC transporter substrate-binding protein n=1 Tax=Vibrio mangrovi TaxID=474394 RepID=A0A1Y6IR70_9VIBR|nr:ABC transporter substrate-binding protein [Vibrio mangrovi]MDW6003906.1 ABC transporter substrate-binding protein [Vibrio mangrovi]SMR99300.1 Glutathione-binding protein GsiB precursor [Vibrio mangrovi]